MEQICGNCEHYIRHFINQCGIFSPILHGHCTYPMIKNREADTRACKYFEERHTDDSINVIEITVKCKTL